MKTKLVYVLTCSPEDDYIEQALMAVWSARYYNPDAHIVLLTDNLTNGLLRDNRGELLNYISEKIVIPFDDDKNMHYRSRWLKTSVRNLIDGDFLFIDSDTIVTCDLSHIEQIEADIAMVRDENIDVANEDIAAARPMIENCRTIGIDITKEKYYFNSGVMYVRDNDVARNLYVKWHGLWKEGVAKGINLDQPTFARANIECGHPVVLLDDKWNTIVQTQIEEVYIAYILHFWHSVSFLYSKRVLSYISNKGLTDFIKFYVLHPTETFLPPDNHVCHYHFGDYFRFYKLLKRTLKDYGRNIDGSFNDFIIFNRNKGFVLWLLKYHLLGFTSVLIILSKMYRVKCSSKFHYYTNYYGKEKEGRSVKNPQPAKVLSI